MSGPWEKFSGGPWTKFSPPAQGRSDAAANAFGSGVLFNLGDEVTAAVRAAAPELSDWMMRGPALQRDESIGGSPTPQTVSQAPDWQGRYDEELKKVRAQSRADEEAYPVLTTGANIAGNVASTALALPAAATAAGPSLIGNAAKLGATGAGLGAAAGFGAGEGGLESRAASAIVPTVVGAGLGAATPFAGALGRSLLESTPGRYVAENVVSPIARKLSGISPQSLSAAAPDGGAGSGGFLSPLAPLAQSTQNVAQTGAVDRLATALQRAKLDPARVQRRLGELGDEAMLADVDPQMLSMARMANTLPGETRSYAKNVLESRDRQAGNRLVRAFEGNEAPPSSYALRGEGQAFDQNLRAVGSRAYGEMDAAGLKQSPELMALYENPIVDRAINKVMAEEAATRTGTSRGPASPIDIMHKVKQEIQDMGVAATGRGSSTQSYFRDLAGEYVRALKAANPALAEADMAYAQAASLPEFFDAGRSFLGRGTSEKATGNSAPALADMLSGANVQQQAAARAGATNAARETALEGTGPARALARRVDQSSMVQGKLGEIYGPARASEIGRRASAESTFAETSNDILRGSKTADKLAEAIDTGNAGLRITPDAISPRLYERIGELLTGLVKPNEAVRDSIGRITLNPNQEENRRILALAAELLRKRGQGAPLRAGLIEGAAGATGGP